MPDANCRRRQGMKFSMCLATSADAATAMLSVAAHGNAGTNNNEDKNIEGTFFHSKLGALLPISWRGLLSLIDR